MPKKKGGFSGILPIVLCALKEFKTDSTRLAYCPEDAVLAEVAPAAFGTLR